MSVAVEINPVLAVLGFLVSAYIFWRIRASENEED